MNSEKLFTEKCLYYKKNNVRIATFVCSASKKAVGPWPITEGLPTLEYHRDWKMVDQVKDMIASGKLGDSWASISKDPKAVLKYRLLFVRRWAWTTW